MCGRYTLKTPAGELQEEFELSAPPELAPRFNIAPSQSVAIVISGSERTLTSARWGLIPAWAKDEKIGYKMINARGETAAERPAYRAALEQRRCLVPADGFFEWRPGPNGRTPIHFRRPAGRPFAFAGLWETWKPRSGGEPVRSCTILTCAANAFVAPVHDRMPVIIPRERYARWLAPGPLPPRELEQLVCPWPADGLESFEVSSLVNSPKNDMAECVLPVR